MYEPLQGFPGLHASSDRGRQAAGLDHGAAEADGKLQSPADRHVWHHRQVRVHPEEINWNKCATCQIYFYLCSSRRGGLFGTTAGCKEDSIMFDFVVTLSL